jgi:hypothetical protein
MTYFPKKVFEFPNIESITVKALSQKLGFVVAISEISPFDFKAVKTLKETDAI